MGGKQIVDADAHVLECEETWDFLEAADKKHRPKLVRPVDDPTADQSWLIDGRTIGSRAHRGPKATALRPIFVDIDAGTLENVPKRLAQMDDLGVDTQVIFASLFLHRMTDRAEVEIALVRAYNRFMAAKCADTGGRLQWTMELPWISIADAIDELKEGVALGACGVHARGLEVGRILSDPYFFPVFEAAQELDIPICIHAGEGEWKSQGRILATPEPAFILSKLPGIIAFHALAAGDVYSLFPRLRFGFVELSASWIPYIATDMKLRYGLSSDRPEPPERMFDDKHIFVGCQNSDDLEQILRHIDIAHLVFGTDYGHTDTTADLHGIGTFQTAHKSEISEPILCGNPQALYAL